MRLVSLSLMASVWLVAGCAESLPAGGLGGDSSASADAEVAASGSALGAWVFLSAPVADDASPTQVTLPPPTSADGRLTNAVVHVTNCLREEGGEPVELFGSVLGAFCREAQTALPDSEGSYLHIPPPDDLADPEDAYSEVHVYYHVNLIHDFFADLGWSQTQGPIAAITNAQINWNRTATQRFGQPAGWSGLQLAAFLAPDAFEGLGLAERDAGALLFGQATVDFSYDVSVVYHEYTHAVIGADRLTDISADLHGLDGFAGAINEGLADYFAASKLGDPIQGPYAAPTQPRDLSQLRRCPDDIATEVHADGLILGSALWAIRRELGAETTDRMAFEALQSASRTTSFEPFGLALLSAAPSQDAARVEAILTDHGVLGCQRSKVWADFQAATSAQGLPYVVEGLDAAADLGFTTWVPGYFQLYLDVPEGKHPTLAWELQTAGPGRESSAIDLALKFGSLVQLDLGGREPTTDASHVVATPVDGGVQSLTLTGQCLPPSGERLHIMLRNRGAAQAAIQRMSVSFVDEPPRAGPIADCAAAPESASP